MSSGLYKFNNQRISVPAVIVLAALFTSGCSTFSRFDFPVFGLDKEVEDTSSIERRRDGDNGEYYRSIYRPGGVPRSDITRSDLPPDSLYDEPRRNSERYRDAEPEREYRSYRESQYEAAPDRSRRGTDQDYGSQSKVFVVRPGDNLYRIALNHGVELDELKRVNGLSGNNISVGQELVIPGGDSYNGGYTSRKRIAKKKFRPSNKRKVTGYYPSRRSTPSSRKRISDEDFKPVERAVKRHNVVRPPEVIRNQQQSEADNQDALNRRKSPEETRQAYRTQRNEQKTPEISRRPERENIKMPKGSGLFRWPAKGRIISKFGVKRNGVRNDGVNLSVPMGTEIRAAEGGVVAYAGNELKGYGKLVLIRHRNKWVSAYAHNSQILVRRGQKIRRGQVIAKAGKSGSVSQPQLHFELRKGSKPVDPLKYL